LATIKLSKLEVAQSSEHQNGSRRHLLTVLSNS
jgi:hypothetical protein